MPVATASKTFVARPIPKGWVLDAILRLDEAHDGFLRFLLRASSLRRQGVFLALTQLDWRRPGAMASWISRANDNPPRAPADPLAIIAHGLISMRVRDLMHAIFGSVSNGLLGALAKSGDDPLHETSYDVLRAIFDDPRNRRRADLLRSVSQIDDMAIKLAWKLPPALLHPAIFQLVRDPDDIDGLSCVLEFVRKLNPLVTDEDIATSLGQIFPGSTFAMWVKKWIDRSTSLTTALPYRGDDLLRPLVSASEFKAVSLKYRNCLRTKVGAVALGRAAYFEYTGDGGAIAELEALSRGQWLLDGVYGPGNGRPAPDAIRYIRTTLEAAGVLVAARFTHGREIDEVASVLGVFDHHGGQWLDIEDDIAGIAA